LDQVALNPTSNWEKDSLHMLPLGILPLRTLGLRQARMIKNSHLDGVIELYHGKSTGSGQVLPDDLPKIFKMADQDIDMLRAVSALPSYDVYSLRIELRRLGIEVEDQYSLKLSADAQAQSRPYMLAFTRPLISFLRAGGDSEADNDGEIMSVLTDVGKAQTRENFVRLAQRLEINLREIPAFLEDYRDVYLSLAYYDLCTRKVQRQSENTLRSFETMRSVPSLAAQPHLMRSMQQVERCLAILGNDVGEIIEDFKFRTLEMWEDISAARFRDMRELVSFYQTRLGASLCAATAKVSAWDERFPPEVPASPATRGTFLHNDMVPGLDKLKRLPKLGRETVPAHLLLRAAS
jgi:hypothetical protein